MAPLPSASVEQARRLVRQATLRRSADAWRKVASTLTRDDLARPAPPESNGCRRHRARLNTRLDRAWSGRRCYDDGPGRPGGYRRRGEPSREWRAARGGAAIFWLAVDLEVNQSTPRHFTGIEMLIVNDSRAVSPILTALSLETAMFALSRLLPATGCMIPCLVLTVQ